MKIKVGVFFGGPSREREASFAAGRMAVDFLPQDIFETVPIFVDSWNNLVLLDRKHCSATAITDFYPPLDLVPASPTPFRIYAESLGPIPPEEQVQILNHIGTPVTLNELPQLINLALLILPGQEPTTLALQAALYAQQIPNTGVGAFPRTTETWSAWLTGTGWQMAPGCFLDSWPPPAIETLFPQFPAPLLVRPLQESSTPIPLNGADYPAMAEIMAKSFYQEEIPVASWQEKSDFDRLDHLRLLTELQDGLGFPLRVTFGDEHTTIFHPEELRKYLNRAAADSPDPMAVFRLTSTLPAGSVRLETNIDGTPFSLLVLKPSNHPGITLIQDPSRTLTTLQQEQVTAAAAKLLALPDTGVFAIIEGCLGADGHLYLLRWTPNPMLSPNALAYQLLLRGGILPGTIWTFLLHRMLQEQTRLNPQIVAFRSLLQVLEENMAQRRVQQPQKSRVAILTDPPAMGYTPRRETALWVFQQLAASAVETPLLFACQAPENHPTINAALLSDFGADTPPLGGNFRDQLDTFQSLYQPLPTSIGNSFSLAEMGQQANLLFLALQNPDTWQGQLQRQLEKNGQAFTGCQGVTLQTVHHRYLTAQTLRRNGLITPEQVLLHRKAYETDPEGFFQRIESRLAYPLLAMPAHSGPQGGYGLILNRHQLAAYTRMLFRPNEAMDATETRRILRIKATDPLPREEEILLEALIPRLAAYQLIPLQVGVLTHYTADNQLEFELLAPGPGPGQPHQSSWLPTNSFAEQRPTPLETLTNHPMTLTQVMSDLEKAARILDLENYALLHALVKLYEDGSCETILLHAEPYPELSPASPFIQSAAGKGYSTGNLLENILYFGRQRPAVQQALKELAWGTAPEALDILPTASSPTAAQHAETLNEFEEAANNEWGAPAYQQMSERLRKAMPQLQPTGIQGQILRSLQNFWLFISSRFFLKNLAAIILALFLLFAGTTLLLRLYTHHGESLDVEDYQGMLLNDARRKARSRSFRIIVMDSVYIVGKAPGLVIDQTPDPGSRVKENRNIYLVVTGGTAPVVSLPDLVGSDDYDQYARRITRLGLFSRIKDRQFDAILEENTILYLLIDGKKITGEDLKRGVKVPKGSTIDFVVSIRNTGTIPVPNLVCLPYDEAAFIIRNSQLAIGNVFGTEGEEDLSGYYVWKQEPAYDTSAVVNIGAQVNLHLMREKPAGCE